jgi:excinuclease UvrABC nuclease subunit
MNIVEIPKKRYEPWEELPEKNLRKVNALTDVVHKATDSIEVNLATDVLKVPGQNWACVSFVSPDGNQKNKSIGMKIRGVFDTQQEATEHVKRLIRIDPMFDIFICDMYNWVLVPPDPEHVNDQTYQDETLNNIISGYRKNQVYAKEHFEERKREMMEQAADEVRRSVLKKLEEESQEEMEKAAAELSPVIEDRTVDITELDNEGTPLDVAFNPDKTGGFISASELMAEMVGRED